MYYIFDSNKRLTATCDGKPNMDDLTSRGEFAVKSDQNIPFGKVALDENGNVIEKAE